MYTIAMAAEVTGVCPETIRAWQETYGLLGDRRARDETYAEPDLRVLAGMAALVEAGWRPADAAIEARRRVRHGEPAPQPPAVRGDPGRTAPPVDWGSDDLTEAFVAAAAAVDARGLGETLDAAWQCFGADQVADRWLLPALRRLGDVARRRGEIEWAGAHLARDLARARLLHDFDDASRGLGAGRVGAFVGVAPGVARDVGPLALAVLLTRAGLPSAFLNGRVPEPGWVTAVRAAGARHVVLDVPEESAAAPTSRLVGVLVDAVPAVAVHVAGTHRSLVGAPANPLGEHVAMSADALALAVAFERLPRSATRRGGDAREGREGHDRRPIRGYRPEPRRPGGPHAMDGGGARESNSPDRDARSHRF